MVVEVGGFSAEEHWLYCEPLLNEQVHWRKLVSTTCIHKLWKLVNTSFGLLLVSTLLVSTQSL